MTIVKHRPTGDQASPTRITVWFEERELDILVRCLDLAMDGEVRNLHPQLKPELQALANRLAASRRELKAAPF